MFDLVKHPLRRACRHGLLLLAPLLTVGAFSLGQESGSWEMRVCADPSALPFSNEQEEGFENRIADIIADELGATLSYDWYPLTSDLINLRLRGGECDVIMGLPDGTGAVLNTVAYYRSPYVFVYREDADFTIESLDDPVLADLRIAVQNTGIPPHEALLERGLADNIVYEYLDGEPRIGVSRSMAAIRAVAEGDVDVAAVWGPVAGWLVDQTDAPLVVQAITPTFEPPFRTQSFPMTMAVRMGDESFRHRLDVAIANRWEDINAVLADYSVPTEPLPQPVASPLPAGVTRFGFVGPSTTGNSTIVQSLYDVVGDIALHGAQLAEAETDRLASEAGVEIDLLWSSTPTAEAALRAAQRMVATENIAGFIGGLGDEQAEAIAEVAENFELLFINIGSSTLQRTCESPLTFHVEASFSQYIDALVAWHSQQGVDSWFVILEESPYAKEMLDDLRSTITSAGGTLRGSTVAQREQPSYFAELQQARTSRADAILGMVHARDQIALLGQWESLSMEPRLVLYPHAVTQTRDFLAAADLFFSQQAAHQIQLWETTLEGDIAADLNTTYTSRFGQPADSSAWAAWAAIKILFEALQATSGDVSAIPDYLMSDEAVFDLGKGVPLSFREGNQQLRQPLYVVEVDPQAQWSLRLSDLLNVAHLVGQIPGAEELATGNPVEVLDQLGEFQSCE